MINFNRLHVFIRFILLFKYFTCISASFKVVQQGASVLPGVYPDITRNIFVSNDWPQFQGYKKGLKHSLLVRKGTTGNLLH